mgnify:CR=1 FL=1
MQAKKQTTNNGKLLLNLLIRTIMLKVKFLIQFKRNLLIIILVKEHISQKYLIYKFNRFKMRHQANLHQIKYIFSCLNLIQLDKWHLLLMIWKCISKCLVNILEIKLIQTTISHSSRSLNLLDSSIRRRSINLNLLDQNSSQVPN